jgi:cytoskeletal protein RodZ
MESRRKKPDRISYGLWHQGRHADEGVLEPSKDVVVLADAEPYGETSDPLPDTMTFPERRAPLWVALSVLSVAALVIGLLVIQTVNGTRPSGRTSATLPPVLAVQPTTAARAPVPRPQSARTVTVTAPGTTTRVRVPVPGPTVTARATPTPVPGPTVTIRITEKAAPAKAQPTVTITVTETVTETATPEPTDTGLLPDLFKEKE